MTTARRLGSLGAASLAFGVASCGGAVPRPRPALPAVGSVAELGARTALGGCVVLEGYRGPGDGGGGTFCWDATSTRPVDGGTVLRGRVEATAPCGPASSSASAAGRWVRRDAGPLDVRWFGARGDGRCDDRPAIQRALDAARGRALEVLVPPGTFDVGAPLELASGASLRGVRGASRLRATTPDQTAMLAILAPATGVVTDVRIRDLVLFPATQDERSAQFGIVVSGQGARAADRVLIEGCEGHGFKRAFLRVASPTRHLVFRDNYVHHIKHRPGAPPLKGFIGCGLAAGYLSDSTVAHNRFVDVGSELGDWAVYLSGRGEGDARASNDQIVDNEVTSDRAELGGGLKLGSGAFADGLIARNHVRGRFHGAVHVDGTVRAVVEGNYLERPWDGVQIDGFLGLRDVVVRDNVVDGLGSEGRGMVVTDAAEGVLIEDNVIGGFDRTRYHSIGVFVAMGTGVEIVRNHILGVSLGVYLQSAKTARVRLVENHIELETTGGRDGMLPEGVLMAGVSDVTLERNVVRGGGYGIDVQESTRVRLLGNDVAGATRQGVGANAASEVETR
jgi:hypothetical protein